MIWGYPNDLGTIMNHPYQNINPTDCGWNKLWYGLIVVKLTIINPNYIVLKCLEVITQYSYSPDSSLSPHWGAPPCGWGRAPDGNRRRFLQVSPTWTYLFGDIWRPLPYYVWIYQSYSITINLMWSDLDIYIYTKINPIISNPSINIPRGNWQSAETDDCPCCIPNREISRHYGLLIAHIPNPFQDPDNSAWQFWGKFWWSVFHVPKVNLFMVVFRHWYVCRWKIPLMSLPMSLGKQDYRIIYI